MVEVVTVFGQWIHEIFYSRIVPNVFSHVEVVSSSRVSPILPKFMQVNIESSPRKPTEVKKTAPSIVFERNVAAPTKHNNMEAETKSFGS